MIPKILVLVLLALVAIVVFAATRPDTFRIQRSLTINASPQKIFPLINDLHNWPQWAPQDREDSTMQRSFSGADSGVGAASEWSGSGSTGRGQMTITQSDAPKLVALKVDFEKPFVAHNVNEFRLEPDGASTRITWSMHGTNLFMMKLMSVFTNMDRMMGKHFEAGLANLKAAAER